MDSFNWTLVGVVGVPFVLMATFWPWLALGYAAGAVFMFASMFMYMTSYRYYNRVRRQR